MTNRSTLIISPTPEYSRDISGTGILAWSRSIAVLWFALFRVEDLKHLRHEEDGQVFMIPYLVTPAADARRNLQQRKSSLLTRLTPSGGVPGLYALEAAITNASGFVILDAWEIYTLGMEDRFLTDSINNIDALNLQPICKQAYMHESLYHFNNYDEGGDYPQPYCGYPWAT